MQEHCFKCLSAVPEREGYENSVGETLCNECYRVMFATKTASRLPEFAHAALQSLVRDPRSLA
jgi:hypothetical protein